EVHLGLVGPALEYGHFAPSHLDHLGVVLGAEHLLGLSDRALKIPVLSEFRHNLVEVAMLLGRPRILRLISQQLRIYQLLGQLFVFLLYFFELFEHDFKTTNLEADRNSVSGFQRERRLERSDRDLELGVIGFLRRYVLKPQARPGNYRQHKLSSTPCRGPDHLVGDARDEGDEEYTGRKIEQQRIESHHRKRHDRDQHYKHQETGPTSRMLAGFGARVLDSKRLPGLPYIHYLMFRPMVFKYAPDILKAGHRPDHYKEEQHPDEAVDQIERYSRADGLQGR